MSRTENLEDLTGFPLSWCQRLRFAPFLTQLVLTERCNLRCRYCFEFDPHASDVPREILEKRIDRIALLGSWALEFTGGEPLLHEFLTSLVAYASGKGFRVLGLITNGTLLKRSLILELNRAGLTEMQVSVDGMMPREDTAKALRNIQEKLEILSRLADFKVVLSSVVGRRTPLAEIEAVTGFARRHGFRPRFLLEHGPDGRLDQDPEELQGFLEIQKVIGRRFRDFSRYRERLIERGRAPFRCRAGSRYLYVDAAGYVCRCAHTRRNFRKPLFEYTLSDLRRQFFTYKGCNPQCTVGCARSCSVVDAWFPQKLRDGGGQAAEENGGAAPG